MKPARPEACHIISWCTLWHLSRRCLPQGGGGVRPARPEDTPCLPNSPKSIIWLSSLQRNVNSIQQAHHKKQDSKTINTASRINIQCPVPPSLRYCEKDVGMDEASLYIYHHFYILPCLCTFWHAISLHLFSFQLQPLKGYVYVSLMPRPQLQGEGLAIRVLARPFPKGTVPFGASNVPFGSAPKPTMYPLAPPQNQHIFNSHLNYLDLKTVWVQTTVLPNF